MLLLAAGAALPWGAADGEDLLVFRRGWVYHFSPEGERRLVQAEEGSRSPDGHHAVCLNGQALFVVEIRTGKAVWLTGPEAGARQPVWSPRGDQIAFVAVPGGGEPELRLVHPDGSEPRTLVAQGAEKRLTFFGLTWSPDGGSLIFHDLHHIYRVTLEGKTATTTPVEQITGEPYCVSSSDRFVQSPADPRVLAYTRAVGGPRLFERRFGEPKSGLFLYHAGSRTSKRLTPPDLLATSPAWSKDGAQIYFSGYYGRDRAAAPLRVYRIRPDGTGLAEVTRGERPSP